MSGDKLADTVRPRAVRLAGQETDLYPCVSGTRTPSIQIDNRAAKLLPIAAPFRGEIFHTPEERLFISEWLATLLSRRPTMLRNLWTPFIEDYKSRPEQMIADIENRLSKDFLRIGKKPAQLIMPQYCRRSARTASRNICGTI